MGVYKLCMDACGLGPSVHKYLGHALFCYEKGPFCTKLQRKYVPHRTTLYGFLYFKAFLNSMNP